MMKTILTFLFIASLPLTLAACGDGKTGTSDVLSEALKEAGIDASDFNAEELAAAEEMLAGVDLARRLPDDFPEVFPLPNDIWVTRNISSDGDEGREIYISLSSAEDLGTWVDRYRSELSQHFTVQGEKIAASEEEAKGLAGFGSMFKHVHGQWEFSGLGWTEGHLYVMDAQAVHADLNPEWLTENQIKQFEEAYGDASITMTVILRAPASSSTTESGGSTERYILDFEKLNRDPAQFARTSNPEGMSQADAESQCSIGAIFFNTAVVNARFDDGEIGLSPQQLLRHEDFVTVSVDGDTVDWGGIAGDIDRNDEITLETMPPGPGLSLHLIRDQEASILLDVGVFECSYPMQRV